MRTSSAFWGLVAIASLAGCAAYSAGPTALAQLQPTRASTVTGTVRFEQSSNGVVHVSGEVRVEGGVVTFYFASGKADVASGASNALADVVQGVAAGKKALVSGFHDATGSAELNAELSKQRALAVRDALLALGVAEASIELKKPEETQLGGPAEQARRVEVVLE